MEASDELQATVEPAEQPVEPPLEPAGAPEPPAGEPPEPALPGLFLHPAQRPGGQPLAAAELAAVSCSLYEDAPLRPDAFHRTEGLERLRVCKAHPSCLAGGKEEAPFTLPLLLSELGIARDRASGQTLLTLTSTEGQTWLILVDGTLSDARSCLMSFGHLGSISSCFDRIYRLEGPSLVQGSSGVVHALSPRLADDDIGVPLAAKSRRPERGINQVPHELSMMAAAQGHPNVARLFNAFYVEEHGAGHQGRTLMLVIENYASGDLRARTAAAVLPNLEIQRTMSGILAGLTHLHLLEMAHRDVKPENVLAGPSGQAVLVDFALACQTSDAERMTERCGTPGFAAPELIAGHQYCCKVDCFSAGCVGYFLHAGVSPFGKHTVRRTLIETRRLEVHMRMLDERQDFANASYFYKDLLIRLLTKDPARRLGARTASTHPYFEAGRDEPNNDFLERLPSEDLDDFDFFGTCSRLAGRLGRFHYQKLMSHLRWRRTAPCIHPVTNIALLLD